MTSPLSKGDRGGSPRIPNARHTGSTPGMAATSVTRHKCPFARIQFPAWRGWIRGIHPQLGASLPAAGGWDGSDGTA